MIFLKNYFIKRSGKFGNLVTGFYGKNVKNIFLLDVIN